MARNKSYPTEIITDVDDADDSAPLANTPAQAKSKLHIAWRRQQDALASTWTQTK